MKEEMPIRYSIMSDYEMCCDAFDTYEEALAEAKHLASNDPDFVYYIVRVVPCAKVYIPDPEPKVEKI